MQCAAFCCRYSAPAPGNRPRLPADARPACSCRRLPTGHDRQRMRGAVVMRAGARESAGARQRRDESVVQSAARRRCLLVEQQPDFACRRSAGAPPRLLTRLRWRLLIRSLQSSPPRAGRKHCSSSRRAISGSGSLARCAGQQAGARKEM